VARREQSAVLHDDSSVHEYGINAREVVKVLIGLARHDNEVGQLAGLERAESVRRDTRFNLARD